MGRSEQSERRVGEDSLLCEAGAERLISVAICEFSELSTGHYDTALVLYSVSIVLRNFALPLIL